MSTGQTVPTAPGRLPGIGHALRLALPSRLGYLQSLRAYGPVVRLYLGTYPIYLFNSPEALREMLQVQSRKFVKGRFFENTRPFIGTGILASEGDFHLRQRRMMQPAFHRQRIAQYIAQMNKEFGQFVENWPARGVISVEQEMRHVTTGVVSHTLLTGTAAGDMAALVEEALPVFVFGVAWRTLAPTELLGKLPTRANRRFDLLCAKLRDTTAALIRERRAAGTDDGDLLSMLLAARDQDTGEPMSDEEIRDEIITVFTAGVETVATTLSWACYALAAYPDVARRLAQEIDQVLAGRPVERQDLSELRYTHAVLNETLRAYHPNWLLMRRSTEAVDIAGMSIPAGAEIIYSVATLHRDPGLFPEPDRFLPDRWLGPEAELLPRGAFLPFGAGNHQCIGESFAMTEMAVALTVIAAKWRLEPAPGRRHREVAAAILHPKSLQLRVSPRQ